MDEKYKLAKECLFAFSRSVHQRIQYLQDVVLQDCLTDDQVRILKKIGLEHLSSFVLRDQGRKQEVMKGLMRTITALRAADIAADRAANELEDHFNCIYACPEDGEDDERTPRVSVISPVNTSSRSLRQIALKEEQRAKIRKALTPPCEHAKGSNNPCVLDKGHPGPHEFTSTPAVKIDPGPQPQEGACNVSRHLPEWEKHLGDCVCKREPGHENAHQCSCGICFSNHCGDLSRSPAQLCSAYPSSVCRCTLEPGHKITKHVCSCGESWMPRT